MPATKNRAGLWELHVSVLILGGTTMFPKLLPLPPSDLIFARSCVAAITLLILLFLWRKPVRLHSQTHSSLTLHGHGLWIGMLMGLHWLTFFHAIQLAGPATAVTAFYSFPLISVLLESILNKQTPAKQQLGAACAVIVGVLLLMPELNMQNQATSGVLWGVLSALFFALRNVCQRQFLLGQPAIPTMFWQLLGVFILCLPLQSLLFVGLPTHENPSSIWLGLCLLGIVFTAIPHSLYVRGLMFIPASTAGLIGSLQPFYSTVLGLLLLNDMPTIRTLFGASIIVAVACYESLMSTKR